MKSNKVWINGKIVNIKNAKISVFDRGFLYGDGVFETMRSYAGKVFKMDDHLDRLFPALKIMSIKPPFSSKGLKEAVYKTIKINGLKGAYIRLAITRGEGRFGIAYKDSFAPNVVIVAKEFEGYPVWMHRRGITARVVGIRQNELSPLSGIKSLNFLGYILARFEAKEAECDDAILLNTKGDVAEGATSNIFLVKGNAVITPSLDSGILPGITRSVVIKIVRALKFKVREARVSRRELLSADEVFFTNSLAEILPVVKVDSKKIGSGRPGEITKLLHISYQKQVIRETLR